jgi:chromosome segregation ATPase
MGACDSKKAAISETRDEISRLQRLRSELLIKKDQLKGLSKMYPETEEEIENTFKTVSIEFEELNHRIDRLEPLKKYKAELKDRINCLDQDISSVQENFATLNLALDTQKAEISASTEEINSILQEINNLSAESIKYEEELKELNVALQQNLLIEEKIKINTEKISEIAAIDLQIAENSEEIAQLEEKISEITPLIDSQNLKHQSLIDLDNEIVKIQGEIESSKLSEAQINYLKQVQSHLLDINEKTKVLDKRISACEDYDMNLQVLSKESYESKKRKIKNDIKQLITPEKQNFYEYYKLETKKIKLQKQIAGYMKEYEIDHGKLTFKIETKQAEKISLETQLKELKEILDEATI